MNDSRRDLSRYIVGLLGSAVLTAVPFWMVIGRAADRSTTLTAIALCAIAQVVLQLRCFLHIDFNRKRREDLLLILFTTLILILLIGGTIWIMTSLSYRMH